MKRVRDLAREQGLPLGDLGGDVHRVQREVHHAEHDQQDRDADEQLGDGETVLAPDRVADVGYCCHVVSGFIVAVTPVPAFLFVSRGDVPTAFE